MQGASAGASATSAASGNSFISYAPPHAVSKLSAAHERGPLSFSLKPGEQAGNANGTSLQATLTKIAQLLRDIFNASYPLFNMLSQAQQYRADSRHTENRFHRRNHMPSFTTLASQRGGKIKQQIITLPTTVLRGVIRLFMRLQPAPPAARRRSRRRCHSLR